MPPPPPDTPHDTIIRYRQQIVEKGLAGAPRFDGTASSFTVFEDTLANLAETYPACQSGITMADMVASDLPQRLSTRNLTQAPPLLNGLLHALLSPLLTKEAADIMTSANRVEGKTSDGAHVLAELRAVYASSDKHTAVTIVTEISKLKMEPSVTGIISVLGKLNACNRTLCSISAAESTRVLHTADAANAFQTPHRTKTFDAVKRDLPELLPYVRLLYGGPTSFFVAGNDSNERVIS